jgi:hypothetical protein
MKSKLFLNFIASRTMSLNQHRKDVCQAVGYFLTGIGAASARSAGVSRQKPLPVARLQLSNKV